MQSIARQRVVILQSNYIPWKGYFGLIRECDRFLFLDEVQSTKNDWRNRNRIKTANGEAWLTIPTHHSLDLRVREVTVADPRWARKHWASIGQAYARAPHMPELRDWLQELYARAGDLQHLSEINQLFVASIAEKLNIVTPISRAGDLLPEEVLDRLDPSARLVKLCRRVGATHYLSGPAARDYLDLDAFRQAGIEVEWADYQGYPPYQQLHGDFRPNVSVLDLLLMTGTEAPRYLKRGELPVVEAN